MGYGSALAKVLSSIPSGLVRRASEPREQLTALPTGLTGLDTLLGGGWARSRLNMLEPGPSASTGRTTIASSTVAAVTAAGMQAAWIDGDGSLDLDSLAATGTVFERLLWVRGPLGTDRVMKAASQVISSGVFEVVVLRPSGERWSSGAAMQWARLSREAGATRTTVLVLAGSPGMPVPGSSGVFFTPMLARWTGPFGQAGFLDGATILVNADDDGAASIPATADYGGLQ